MADTFGYYNKRTQTIEQRPMKPSFFQKAYESAAYPDDIDSQRMTAQRVHTALNSPDKSTTMPVPEE